MNAQLATYSLNLCTLVTDGGKLVQVPIVPSYSAEVHLHQNRGLENLIGTVGIAKFGPK